MDIVPGAQTDRRGGAGPVGPPSFFRHGLLDRTGSGQCRRARARRQVSTGGAPAGLRFHGWEITPSAQTERWGGAGGTQGPSAAFVLASTVAINRTRRPSRHL